MSDNEEYKGAQDFDNLTEMKDRPIESFLNGLSVISESNGGKRNMEKILDDAWLNIDEVDQSKIFNPMDFVFGDTSDNEVVLERLAYLMGQPEYFYFTAKYILNVELLPFQSVILKELWEKKFPMLIGSRGLGKAEPITTGILTQDGWVTMGNVLVGTKVYGRDGKLHNVTAIHPQGKKQICRITFADGRTNDCCEDHLWVVRKGNGKERTLSIKEIINSGLTWIGPSGKHAYKYKVPHCDPIEYEKNDLPINPYILGCLLGDGTMNTKTPKIASDDYFIVDQFKKHLEGFEINQDPTNNNYTLVDRQKEYTEIIRCNGKYLSRSRNRLTDKIEKLGLNVGCKGKFIPEIYKKSSIEDRMEIVRGLLDTDGSVSKHGAIEFTNTCERLVDDIIEVLRSLGISCIKSNDNREGQSHILPSGKDSIRGFCYRVFINTSKPVFKLPRKLERIKKKITCREKYNAIISAEYIDEHVEMQCITVDSPDHTYITKDYVVTHNSFLLAVYAILRCLIMPRRKIIVVGAAFRQSKVIYEYMETIWKHAPVLRDLCDNSSGPFKDIDRCVMKINGGTVTCLPLGSGDKIRGQRAHDIINDEFSCLSHNSLVQTDLGLVKISDIVNGKPYSLLNMDNEFEYPDMFFRTPLTDVFRVKTDYGYYFDCSSIHKVMTNKGWKLQSDLKVGDYIQLGWNEYFPESNFISEGGFDVNKDTAWLMGLLVSEGNVTNRNFINIGNTDRALIDNIKEKTNLDWIETYRPAYKDSRGWDCKESWVIQYNNTKFRQELREVGMDFDISINKKIPFSMLQSPRDVTIHFLNGMYEGDGSCFFVNSNGGKEFQAVLYSSSLELLETTQTLLLKFKILSSINSRASNKISKRGGYRLVTRGSNAIKLFNLLDVMKWKSITPPENTSGLRDRKPQVRKNGNRYTVSTSFCNRNKHLGSFDTIEQCNSAFDEFWNQTNEFMRIKSIEMLPEQQVLYDIHMPETHSFIANGFIQHNSMPREIFENVVAGFAAVSASPLENVKRVAKEKAAQKKNITIKDKKYTSHMANQIVLAGTAYYEFNHFAQEWKKYKRIIETGGDKGKIQELLKMEDVSGFNYNDYTIIRIPVTTLPEGFMDSAQINRARATVHSGIFQMEYGSVFTSDSQGFFKRSLIEACTCSPSKPIRLPSGEVNFDAVLKGDSNKQYIYGIDPASEIDNFSIVILEDNKDHRRLVHCWTTTRNKHKEQLKTGLIEENDFYSYCCRKIRNLMKVFPCREIALDSQGGGIAIIEGLHDKDKVKEGELPIWPKIDPEKPNDTDDMPGLHLVQMCNFAKADWLGEANHGLRKDLEDKVLLFPYFDTVSLGISLEDDNIEGRLYDTLEDCFMEIEELKNELSMISVSLTPSGREHWDTPSTKVATGKKDKLRKDRYSALVIANMLARQVAPIIIDSSYYSVGGFARAGESSTEETSKDYYIGPNWFTQDMENMY